MLEKVKRIAQLKRKEVSNRQIAKMMNRKPYRLTQFKKYFSEELKKAQFTDIIHHKPGEQIEVD